MIPITLFYLTRHECYWWDSSYDYGKRCCGKWIGQVVVLQLLGISGILMMLENDFMKKHNMIITILFTTFYILVMLVYKKASGVFAIPNSIAFFSLMVVALIITLLTGKLIKR